MPGIRESALKAPTGGRFLPQGPLWCKRADGAGRGQNRQKSARAASTGATPGQSGSHPLFLTSKCVGSEFRRAMPPRPALLLPWAVHRCHRLVILRYHGYWVRHEGRSRQGREKVRRGHEGFTTRPAEAGVARKSQETEVAGARARRGERIFRNRRCLPRYRQRRKAIASSVRGKSRSLAGWHGLLSARVCFFFRQRQ